MPLWGLYAFNNVISNVGYVSVSFLNSNSIMFRLCCSYVLLGLLFLIIVRRRQRLYKAAQQKSLNPVIEGSTINEADAVMLENDDASVDVVSPYFYTDNGTDDHILETEKQVSPENCVGLPRHFGSKRSLMLYNNAQSFRTNARMHREPFLVSRYSHL